MRGRLIRSALAAGLGLSLTSLAGCDVYYSNAYVSRDVVVAAPIYDPPLPVEVVTVQPGPAYVWVGGYYDYYGGGYVWRPGYWGRPPRPGLRFFPPRYVRGYGGGFVMVHGGWR